MTKRFERYTLRFLFVLGLIMFVNLIRKPPAKDWLLIFLFKGFISSILDKTIVTKNKIVYRVKLFKSFDISFVFDYLLFPVVCVYYNQITKSSNLFLIIVKLFYFSVPRTLIENFFEKRTSLIKFKNGWNIYHSFLTLSVTFLISRTFIALVRSADNTRVPENT